MNARQFFDLVAEMRSAQKNYYALRKAGADKVELRQALQQSLGIESQVDHEIERVRSIINQSGGKP